MILESKIIVLLLGMGLLILMYIPSIRKRLKTVPGMVQFNIFYCFILIAWLFDFIEHFYPSEIMSYLRLTSYMVSSFMLILWIVKVTRVKEN